MKIKRTICHINMGFVTIVCSSFLDVPLKNWWYITKYALNTHSLNLIESKTLCLRVRTDYLNNICFHMIFSDLKHVSWNQLWPVDHFLIKCQQTIQVCNLELKACINFKYLQFRRVHLWTHNLCTIKSWSNSPRKHWDKKMCLKVSN